ncbi:MAG: hypothetical protein ACREUZ_07170, partial [Burkholderiales bacterium]
MRRRVRAVRATEAHRHTLRAAPGDLNYAYGPKGSDLANLRVSSLDAASVSVEFDGFTAEAQAAFQAAVDLWAATITTPVPIRIRANWTPLASGVLGTAGPTTLCSRWENDEFTFYSAALADKLSGSQSCAALGSETAEIDAEFNSTFPDWEFGTSGTGVPGKYNFMTVALHEIGHGLGFFGLFQSSGGTGALWGDPSIYDRFSVSGSGDPLLGLESPSTALHDQLTGNNTFFNGAAATARNAGSSPKLDTHYFDDGDFGWSEGSSYSHVDDQLYTG